MRVALVVAYDGRAFFGFQRQARGRTVQQELETAFFDWFGTPVAVVGSGRTDRGVHAFGQVVHADLPRAYPPEAVPGALNARLAPDVRVLEAHAVADDFHARFDARAKTYVYRLSLRPVLLPMDRGLVAHIPYALDVSAMAEAATAFCGRHDFAGFANAGSAARTTHRTIHTAALVQRGRELFFWVRGDGFLYNMVRNIVGTLIDVGRGKLSRADVQRRLAGDRAVSRSSTAPPDGLYLYRVEYDALATPDPDIGFPKP
ncbi:MAG: tRNA pseudouridine(38-40) synthase TruA [Hydrogenibacillus sp.]|nr:tRNA pseudouridine(38-40) synthase TruA [Hydrogenibacillus sp.]